MHNASKQLAASASRVQPVFSAIALDRFFSHNCKSSLRRTLVAASSAVAASLDAAAAVLATACADAARYQKTSVQEKGNQATWRSIKAQVFFPLSEAHFWVLRLVGASVHIVGAGAVDGPQRPPARRRAAG